MTNQIKSKIQNLIIHLIKVPAHAEGAFVRITKFSIFWLKEFFAYFILISFYVLDMFFVSKIPNMKYIPYKEASKFMGCFYKTYSIAIKRFNKSATGAISRLDLIQLAIRNMMAKKVRTLITIGGVSIGIGAIVFLVSLGYGLQRLVVSRVARLEELKQADVATQPGSKVLINDKTLSDVKSFTNVEDVYPLIAAVGRVNYQNSISDMAVYGVTTGYLEKSAIKPVKGKVFESNDLAFTQEAQELASAVQGAASERKEGTFGNIISGISFKIEPERWVRVREGPNINSRILGYTKRAEGTQQGIKIYGSPYEDSKLGKYAVDSDGKDLGVWIKSKVYIWSQEGNEYKPKVDDSGNQTQIEGYFAGIGINEQGTAYQQGAVLGLSDVREAQVLAMEDLNEEAKSSTASALPASTNPIDNIVIDPTSDWVEIKTQEDTVDESIKRVALPSHSVKQAVVNRAMLKILGINEEEAVGKTFSASFIIPSYLLENNEKRVESEPAEYTIVGVTPDDASPMFYVPFVDLRSLGIVNFSQFKVSVNDTLNLDKARKQIEALGYSTSSVTDTVDQINNLFGTVRLVLGVMGMIALAVASLGMFNTLTVSLLERSREIGLMKAMGMTTEEVQQLFLTESILMGFCAGFGGLFIGFIVGKSIGIILTFFSIFKGQGFIDVSQIPYTFILVIMFLSFLVGLVTGIYPAKRSKKISALDALRYE